MESPCTLWSVPFLFNLNRCRVSNFFKLVLIHLLHVDMKINVTPVNLRVCVCVCVWVGEEVKDRLVFSETC